MIKMGHDLGLTVYSVALCGVMIFVLAIGPQFREFKSDRG